MVGEESTVLSSTLGAVLLAVFSIVWVALGIWWGRKSKNLDGHMLAGRNVGLALGSATAVATWVTSNTTMLAPQLALEMGIWGMLAYSTASIGLFLFAPMAARIRKLMPHGYTSAQFMELRYGKVAWAIFMVISVFYGITWLVSMGMAGGFLLEALSGIPYPVGMSVILLVCVLYTLFGGLFAVIGTDFIQSVVVLVGVVVVGFAVIDRADLSEVYTNLSKNRPALLDAFMPVAIIAVFNNLLFGLGEIFHSNVWWSRAFAMREGIGRKAYAMGGLIWLPIPVAAGFIALAAPALDMNVVHPNMVAPLVTGRLLGSVGGVLIFVVVFASIASSIDSLLAATSDLFVNEVVRRVMKNPTDAKLRKAASWVVAGIGVLAWLICLPNIGTLATVLFFAGPLVGSAIWPILAGLYWKQTNPKGVVAAMLLGSAAGLVAFETQGWYTGALVGTTVSMVLVIVSTKLAPHDFDWSKLEGEPVKKEASS